LIARQDGVSNCWPRFGGGAWLWWWTVGFSFSIVARVALVFAGVAVVSQIVRKEVRVDGALVDAINRGSSFLLAGRLYVWSRSGGILEPYGSLLVGWKAASAAFVPGLSRLFCSARL